MAFAQKHECDFLVTYINQNATHGYYDKAYGWYDVVVVGGGPAGMAAAATAAEAGAEAIFKLLREEGVIR